MSNGFDCFTCCFYLWMEEIVFYENKCVQSKQHCWCYDMTSKLHVLVEEEKLWMIGHRFKQFRAEL